MSQKKLNVAIVGLGFGAEFIPIYQRHPSANMYAICQRSQGKLDEIGDAFGIDKRYTDYEELLRDPNVDAMHINTPIQSHAAQSIAALRVGKHVALPQRPAVGQHHLRGHPGPRVGHAGRKNHTTARTYTIR